MLVSEVESSHVGTDMASVTEEASSRNSQKQFAQHHREGSLSDSNQPRVIEPGLCKKGNDEEKLKSWHSLKARLSYPGTQPTRYQEQSLKAFFIASLPTPKPRTLPEPSADEPSLIPIYEQLSTAIVPRRPRRIAPPTTGNMGINSAAMKAEYAAMDAKTAAKKGNTGLPPSPENTSSSGSDDENGEPEPVTPPTSQGKGKSKKKPAPATSTAKKPASTVPAKRKNDDCNEGGKKEDGSKGTVAKKISKNAPMVDTPQATPVPVEPASAMDPTAFSSPVFDVFVGKGKQQYSAHQAILAQSPVLQKLCNDQGKKKGRAKTCLLLPTENPGNFGALLQYLYTGSVHNNVPVNPTDTEVEAMAKSAKRLAKLYCVGAAYELSELQAFITKQLHETKLWERLPGMEFFELAEKLYPDDPDEAETDSFAKFFADHAPAMIKTVPEHRVMDLLRMVSNGGAYAEAIFMAFSVAARNGLDKPKDNSEPKKSNTKGSGIEHLDKEGQSDATNPNVTKELTKVDVSQEDEAQLDAPAELADGT